MRAGGGRRSPPPFARPGPAWSRSEVVGVGRGRHGRRTRTPRRCGLDFKQHGEWVRGWVRMPPPPPLGKKPMLKLNNNNKHIYVHTRTLARHLCLALVRALPPTPYAPTHARTLRYALACFLLMRTRSRVRAGRKREPKHMIESTTNRRVVTAIAPDECDNCHLDLRSFRHFYDAKTRNGPWGWLCEECFRRLGCSIGIGRGQEYLSTTNEKTRG